MKGGWWKHGGMFPPSSHHGLHHSGANSVGYKYHQCNGDEYEKSAFELCVLEKNVNQHGNEQRPGERVCDCVHDIVPEQRVATIDGQCGLLVK